MTANVTQLMNAIVDAKLSVDEMRQLNKGLVTLLRQKHTIAAATVGSKFHPGQIVRFNAKTRGYKFMKIEKFNRAGTAVVGHECDKDGTVHQFATRWTVGATLIEEV